MLLFACTVIGGDGDEEMEKPSSSFAAASFASFTGNDSGAGEEATLVVSVSFLVSFKSRGCSFKEMSGDELDEEECEYEEEEEEEEDDDKEDVAAVLLSLFLLSLSECSSSLPISLSFSEFIANLEEIIVLLFVCPIVEMTVAGLSLSSSC